MDEARTGITETERENAAWSAVLDLVNQITELDPASITTDNAAFIGGQYLARLMEHEHLAAFRIDSQENKDNLTIEQVRGISNFSREQSGRLQLIFGEACTGDYSKLKEEFREDDPMFIGTIVPRKDLEKALVKFRLIGKRMPLQGPPLKAPVPAWIEEPMPLREQLRQLQEGGGKS